MHATRTLTESNSVFNNRHVICRVEKKGENGDDGGVEGVYHVILAITDDVSYREACARVIPMHETLANVTIQRSGEHSENELSHLFLSNYGELSINEFAHISFLYNNCMVMSWIIIERTSNTINVWLISTDTVCILFNR